MQCTQLTVSDLSVNAARQTLYHFAALALVDPQAGNWEKLDTLWRNRMLLESAALLCDLPEAVPADLALDEKPLTDLDPQRVLDRLPACPEELQHEYERTFGVPAAEACHPHETDYIHRRFAVQRSNTLEDVSRFYREFEFTPSKEHERADHIVNELRFMEYLLSRIARLEMSSEQSPSDDRADPSHTVQTRFLRKHLAWWVPTFARFLSIANRGGFYDAVGVFLAALIPAERALLGVNPAIPASIPRLIERA